MKELIWNIYHSLNIVDLIFTKQKRHPEDFSISQENVSKEQLSTCKQTRRNNSELKVEIRYSSNHCKRKVERIRTESGREEKRRHGRTSRGREWRQEREWRKWKVKQKKGRNFQTKTNRMLRKERGRLICRSKISKCLENWRKWKNLWKLLRLLLLLSKVQIELFTHSTLWEDGAFGTLFQEMESAAQ